MEFRFSRHGLTGSARTLERFFELVPGAASWALLLGAFSLACWRPVVAAILIIAFDLYWLLRLLYMTFFLALSYGWLAVEQHADWMSRLRALDLREQAREDTPRNHGSSPSVAWGLRRRLSEWVHRSTLRTLAQSGQRPPHSREIYHLVIIAIAKEPRDIFEPGIRSLMEQPFPSQQILAVLAVEDRAPAEVKAAARNVQRQYRDRFLDLLLVFHPDGLPGEARVKGANVTAAAKEAATFLGQRGIPFDQVIVSCFDADTVVSPAYFPCLTYHFLVCPDRTRASFQPIPVYHNNIWKVPGFARVLDVGASFFQLAEATNAEQLVTFSSHSMSFKALVDVGYWPVDMISDDSAIFWKAFLHYDGAYRVIPIHVTVSMDVAASDSWRKTAVNVYKQKRRWAWGVENFPIVMRAFLQAKSIPLSKKLTHGWKLFEGHLAWATWPFLLGVIGWLPALFAGREFSSSVVYYSAPRIAFMIFRLASIGLVMTILLSLCLLPSAPVKRPWLKKIGHMVECLFVPVIAVFFSAIPALDAQTRLLLGTSLEFWVTDKKR